MTRTTRVRTDPALGARDVEPFTRGADVLDPRSVGVDTPFAAELEHDVAATPAGRRPHG